MGVAGPASIVEGGAGLNSWGWARATIVGMFICKTRNLTLSENKHREEDTEVQRTVRFVCFGQCYGWPACFGNLALKHLSD